MPQLPQQLLDQIEWYKQTGDYDKALRLVNTVLSQDPKNKEALYQVADIQYRKGEISKAEKPINFLLHDYERDPMGYYIKGVLEMEKTHRTSAKKYLKQALNLMDHDNPEIMRCYGLCEYWSGNRDAGIQHVEKAFEENKFDAEIILNLVEMYVLEKRFSQARKYIAYFRSIEKSSLQCFDREVSYYQNKLALFEEYLLSESEHDMDYDGDEESDEKSTQKSDRKGDTGKIGPSRSGWWTKKKKSS